MNVRRAIILTLALALAVSKASAEEDVFSDAPNGAKQHVASGFVCPLEIGHFDRDAVGQRDPEAGSDYCAYSARDGVYGTITLMPVRGEFDPKAMMAHEFVVQEGTGGRMALETTVLLGPQKTLPVYTRTYDAVKIEAMRYRVQFAGAAVGNWAVQVTVEYADPRDLEVKDDFLNAVYASALAKLVVVPPAP